MAAKILIEITAQKYEQILDRICEILTIELAKQFTITSNALFKAGIWKERFISFDKTDLPAINVSYENSDYGSNTPITSKGVARYNISVIISSAHSTNEKGDTLSALKRNKLLGVIRYILENPNYLRLDFPISPAFIQGTGVESIRTAEIVENDGVHITGGALIFNVRCQEDNGELSVVEAEGYTTQVKIKSTDKGYKYIINN